MTFSMSVGLISATKHRISVFSLRNFFRFVSIDFGLNKTLKKIMYGEKSQDLGGQLTTAFLEITLTKWMVSLIVRHVTSTSRRYHISSRSISSD